MTVNERIKFLVETLEKDNQRQFALKVGVTPTVIGSFMPPKKAGDRVSKPSYEALSKIISAYPHINAEWLLTGKGDPFKGSILNETLVAQPKPGNGNGGLPAVVTVDSQGRDNIVLINHRARGGYLAGYKDPEYIAELPTYRLPGLTHGTFRMFEVEGHSMNPTIKNKDIVVAEWVESLDHIRDERVYVIVTETEGIIVKRVLNRIAKYGVIIAKSDNPNKGEKGEYDNIDLLPGDIKEIWYARGYFSNYFPAPSDLYNRLSNLEVEMGQIKKLIKNK